MKFFSQNTWLFLSFCVVQFFSSWDRVASSVFVAGVCSCSLCFSLLVCSLVFLPNVLVKKQSQEAFETARKTNILLYLLRTFPKKERKWLYHTHNGSQIFGDYGKTDSKRGKSLRYYYNLWRPQQLYWTCTCSKPITS